MNNVDQELWTNEEFYNPFGPDLLRLKINENVRLKLLDSITLWLQSYEPINIPGAAGANLKNSIVDGKMGVVSEEKLQGHTGNIIQNMLCKYGEYYYNRPCESNIGTVWYGIMKSGDFHILHSHCKDIDIAEVSGAIYLEVPDNLPSPQGNMNWVMGGPGQPLYNNTYSHPPQSGDVFLWPGWLLHTVYPFRSEQERIMISFNGQIRGELSG